MGEGVPDYMLSVKQSIKLQVVILVIINSICTTTSKEFFLFLLLKKALLINFILGWQNVQNCWCNDDKDRNRTGGNVRLRRV